MLTAPARVTTGATAMRAVGVPVRLNLCLDANLNFRQQHKHGPTCGVGPGEEGWDTMGLLPLPWNWTNIADTEKLRYLSG